MNDDSTDDSTDRSTNDSSDPAIRAEALEDLLVERGIVDRTRIDALIERYANDIGPMIGARVVARAWTEPDFRSLLLADADTAIEEMGIKGPEIDHLEVKANVAGSHNVVVCTLCSCYPWALLGLPPSWYKSPEYRSRVVRQPRQVLSEMGLDLPTDVHINVWDSSSETRYLVLPERPAGTDEMDAEQLAQLITRDSMIGVAKALSPTDVSDAQ